MSAWAMVIPAAEVSALGPFRLERGLTACLAGTDCWLRGSDHDDPLLARVRHLPARERFAIQGDGALIAAGHRVPRGYLPPGPWVPLAELLSVVPPPMNLNAVATPCELAHVTLVRDDTLREPNALLATLNDWADYATTCPQLRLTRWWFAANEQDAVLIRGTPLPPIAGRRLVEQEGVMVEAGWHWSPRVEAAVLRRKYCVDTLDLLCLFQHDRELTVEVIPGTAFVSATRSAVRLTQQAQLGSAGATA